MADNKVVKADPNGGMLSIEITAGHRHYVRYQADYRARLASGAYSEWILIDYLNGDEGDDENNIWPIANASALIGSQIMVRFVVGRLSDQNEDHYRLRMALKDGGQKLGEIEFSGDLAQDLIAHVGYFSVEAA